MYPIFFSVANKDVAFAEKIWDPLPRDWVYLFSRSGLEGTHLWDEISLSEIPKAKIFVIFWSKNYLSSIGCIREFQQARELVRHGRLRPVLLRLDDTPISKDDANPQGYDHILDDLRDFLDYRTSSVNVSEVRAIELIGASAESLLKSQHPSWSRHELLQSMRQSVQFGRYKTYSSVWVSGFNGVGREHVIREFNRMFTPNGRVILVEINEASLPQQILLRLMSEAFGKNYPQLMKIASAAEASASELATVVEQIFQRGDCVVLKHSRIVEEKIELPEWVDDVVNLLTPDVRCKLFIVSILPLSLDRRNRCPDRIVSQRVPTLHEDEMEAFCVQLIGYFDSDPDRWSDVDIKKIVAAARGTIGFLVSLVRTVSNLTDLDQAELLIAADNARMAEAITIYVRWAFAALKGQDDEQKALLFLDNVTPCHMEDLEAAVKPTRPIVRVISRLLDLGLVEREAEAVYRLTPLLATRLNRDLIQPELLQWLDQAMREFAALPLRLEIDHDEGHDYLKIETKIQAAMLSGALPIPSSLSVFVTASHWFQAGIRLYHKRHMTAAYRLLKKAYHQRTRFSDASRSEVIRYFCLSATRNRQYAESEACITLLNNSYNTKPLAAFLQADLCEHKRLFVDAVNWYEEALHLNQGMVGREERTYRPLIRCILATRHPDFEKAKKYAIRYRNLRRTVFSLRALARVYLHWKYKGASVKSIPPFNIDSLLSDALNDLDSHPGADGAYYEILSEEAEFKGDLLKAYEFIERALFADRRFQLRNERWRLMARSGIKELASTAIREMNAAKGDEDLRRDWTVFLPSICESYVRCLRVCGEPTGKVASFATELPSDEISRIIKNSNKHSDREYLI